MRCRAVLLAAALLALCGLGALAQPAGGVDCFADSSADGCADFRVDSATLEADLQELCKPTLALPGGKTYGWPAACTLREECAAGRADAASPLCAPLALIQSACLEDMGPLCYSKYLVLCAPTSKVQQCVEQPRVPGLTTATQQYQNAQQMCKAMIMAGCDECSAKSSNPDKVTAQALEGNCPNPLGTVSQLCLSMDMDGCQDWASFCADTNGTFTGLCEATPLPAASPAPAPAPVPARRVPATGVPAPGTGGGCYADPTAAACADFWQADDVSRADIATLCDSMPTMVGCSLARSCAANVSAGPFCAPFSLLADICLDMPSMKGCGGYLALCSTPGSVVKQCTVEGPIRQVLLTEQAMDAIMDMCATHTMEGCIECTARWSQCPDPLATLSKLCTGMPGMAQCSRFFAMCNEAGDTFGGVCGLHGGNSTAFPPMKMYLHASVSEIILLKEWVPRSTGPFIASCLAIIAAAVLVQALKAWRLLTEAKWAQANVAPCCQVNCGPKHDDAPLGDDRSSAMEAGVPPPGSCCGGRASPEPGGAAAPVVAAGSLSSSLDVPVSGGHGRGAWWLRRDRGLAQRNAARAAFTMVIVFLDYMLMLVVMTFNLGLIISAILGFGLGALLFGHMWERGGSTAVMAASPETENALEVRFVDSQTCCNAQHV